MITNYYYLVQQYTSTDSSQSSLKWMIFGVVLVCFIVAFILPRFLFNADRMIRNGGIKALAKVLSLKETGITINMLNYLGEVTVDVHSLGQAPFQTSFKTGISRLHPLHVGDEIAVIFDPNDHTKIIMDISPAIPRKLTSTRQ